MKIIINNSLMIPIYEQIVDQIKTLIRKGELKENDNLPSVRALARELKISVFFVKYFSLKKASEFPFFSKGFSLPSAGIMHPCA